MTPASSRESWQQGRQDLLLHCSQLHCCWEINLPCATGASGESYFLKPSGSALAVGPACRSCAQKETEGGMVSLLPPVGTKAANRKLSLCHHPGGSSCSHRTTQAFWLSSIHMCGGTEIVFSSKTTLAGRRKQAVLRRHLGDLQRQLIDRGSFGHIPHCFGQPYYASSGTFGGLQKPQAPWAE